MFNFQATKIILTRLDRIIEDIKGDTKNYLYYLCATERRAFLKCSLDNWECICFVKPFKNVNRAYPIIRKKKCNT